MQGPSLETERPSEGQGGAGGGGRPERAEHPVGRGRSFVLECPAATEVPLELVGSWHSEFARMIKIATDMAPTDEFQHGDGLQSQVRHKPSRFPRPRRLLVRSCTRQ